MRIENTSRELFQFEELSEAAKEVARDWYRESLFSDTYAFDSVIDDAKEIGRLMGIDIKNVYFSVSSSQGDGACFEGSYSFRKNSVKDTLSYAPIDSEIERIVKGFQLVQKRNSYKLSATVKQRGHYQHSGCTEIEVLKNGSELNSYNNHNNWAIEDELKELLRAFMDWIYKRLVAEEEYLSSKESIDENILANDYEFLESGKRA